ncbi:MAG: methionyl-tRNA formyltransferase [Bacteroidales bacterium]|nr:methionyl-tRNA formyltransferase [Bacteroidales bacterium]
MKKVRIVFMGTPEFAVESLRQLAENGYEIAAVVTVPDKPAGRGLKMKESAVKRFAVSQGMNVLQPANLKDAEFISELSSLNANLFVVVAFRKLPDVVWMMPEYGTFNLHASLLPDYRGAAPINHAVINGEHVTGVTTFFLNSEIDTGRIILNRLVSIGPDETAGELHDRMMITGAQLVVETVRAIEQETFNVLDQPATAKGIKPAPRIFREHCKIDWSKTAGEVHNLIRGLSPYPGAYSRMISGEQMIEVKILRSAIIRTDEKLVPGEVTIADRNRLLVSCSDSYIEILQMQASGKKEMRASDFLRGIRNSTLFFEQ